MDIHVLNQAQAHPSSLNLVGCHDNDPGVLLPDHLPEIHHGCWQAALRGNVPSLRAGNLTTDVIGIDVVGPHLTGVCILNGNTCVVNYKCTCVR